MFFLSQSVIKDVDIFVMFNIIITNVTPVPYCNYLTANLIPFKKKKKKEDSLPNSSNHQVQ